MGKVCPWWIGYFLLSPIRKLRQNPDKILSPYIEKGMKILDIGSGMGYFSLPMACMVGDKGKVICIDLQEKMLNKLKRRADKAGLNKTIETRLCPSESLGIEDLKDEIDFVLLFALVHEVPDIKILFTEVFETLKSRGKVLVSEPKGHVTDKELAETAAIAEEVGFEVIGQPNIKQSRSVLLQKK